MTFKVPLKLNIRLKTDAGHIPRNSVLVSLGILIFYKDLSKCLWDTQCVGKCYKSALNLVTRK